MNIFGYICGCSVLLLLVVLAYSFCWIRSRGEPPEYWYYNDGDE